MADPRWSPFGNHDLITTSYDVITSRSDLKGDIFRPTMYFLSITVIAFILAKLWREDIISSPPPAPEDQKKKTLPGQERVN